jgi:hypothetical protein
MARTQHSGSNRSGGDTHQQHMVESHTIETVLECEDSLDLVRLDHRTEHLTHRCYLLAMSSILASHIVRDRKDGAEIIGRVPPLRREPGVVEVQPTNHRADVEGGHDRI